MIIPFLVLHRFRTAAMTIPFFHRLRQDRFYLTPRPLTLKGIRHYLVLDQAVHHIPLVLVQRIQTTIKGTHFILLVLESLTAVDSSIQFLGQQMEKTGQANTTQHALLVFPKQLAQGMFNNKQLIGLEMLGKEQFWRILENW